VLIEIVSFGFATDKRLTPLERSECLAHPDEVKGALGNIALQEFSKA
jgi:hypothetical protein